VHSYRARVTGMLRRRGGLLAGGVILGMLAWRLGSAPFLHALHVVSAGAVLDALLIGLATTVFSAWRWVLVARGLGMRLPLAGAIGGYYRSLFLNAVLPGGVLGDVHRAVRHGRDVGDVGQAARAVVLERAAGQVVLLAAGAVVLAGHLPELARSGLLSPGTRGMILLASTVVLAGNLLLFVVAARAAGANAPLVRLAPLLLLALTAMALPLNIGGWGPREAATTWAFAATGLDARQGLTMALVFGLLAFVAALPGAIVLVGQKVGRRVGRPVEPRAAQLAGPRVAPRLAAASPAKNRLEPVGSARG
jgi:uncharacterized membrane protein YbhN (UPF0104 family)